MEPRVNSTKDNHTAPEDSMRPQDRHSPPYQPADLVAQGDREEAQPYTVFTFLKFCKHSSAQGQPSRMKMGSGAGSGPALQNQRTNLL